MIGFILVKDGINFNEEDTALIFAIAVFPQYRSLNVGARLVDAIITILHQKQIKKLFLHVRVGNARGIKFYETLGFVKLKTIEGFYSDALCFIGYLGKLIGCCLLFYPLLPILFPHTNKVNY